MVNMWVNVYITHLHVYLSIVSNAVCYTALGNIADASFAIDGNTHGAEKLEEERQAAKEFIDTGELATPRLNNEHITNAAAAGPTRATCNAAPARGMNGKGADMTIIIASKDYALWAAG
jgi:hypothetical protein